VTLTQLINNDKNSYYTKQLHHSSIVYNHSQIIPSATRTKVDKIRTVKKIREKRMRSNEMQDESIEDDEFEPDDIDVEELGEIDENSVTDEANYYKENIFNKEDYYLFRGVMYFYSEDYEKAMTDFRQTSKVMHANKHLNQSQNNFIITDEDEKDVEKMSNGSSQTDLSDVGL